MTPDVFADLFGYLGYGALVLEPLLTAEEPVPAVVDPTPADPVPAPPPPPKARRG